MIQVNDTWALDSDSKCWTILRRATEEESAKARARVGKAEPAERTWRQVAYHGRLEDSAAGLLDRMAREAGAKAGTVEELRVLILAAKDEIVSAVKGVAT